MRAAARAEGTGRSDAEYRRQRAAVLSGVATERLREPGEAAPGRAGALSPVARRSLRRGPPSLRAFPACEAAEVWRVRRGREQADPTHLPVTRRQLPVPFPFGALAATAQRISGGRRPLLPPSSISAAGLEGRCSRRRSSPPDLERPVRQARSRWFAVWAGDPTGRAPWLRASTATRDKGHPNFGRPSCGVLDQLTRSKTTDN